MTVLPKPSAIIKKTPIITDAPLVEKPINEDKIDIHPSHEWPKRSSNGVMCLSLTATVLALLGFTGGLLLCQDMLKPTTIRRFQGYCSVPIPNNDKQWSTDDIQVINTERSSADQLEDALHEEFDIGDTVEKISVVNNGHRVNFIHDFSDNTTGIIDDERCFVMELEPELVLTPQLFISGLQNGAQFDVSLVRSELRAALPALTELRRAAAELAARCAGRPVYRLHRDDAIRKRSADEPTHDYIQFSGNHVQEIKIDNLPEILEYERQNKA
ncbi:uncharacterized protein LOC126781236 isoform X2 [Nymphalis io]|uniref:uncharacterized protein LOC126781236 isoform X2 n=1 Tax=Inachis io TaxID=171585 RepID=UPI00216A6E8E|nr:uncharacterized protein LOC126781236 isoform X2 [Nymphalis io]